MNNSQFRGPLFQSAAVLAGVIILAMIAASSGAGGAGGGILGVIVGIGKTILFGIGLAVGLGFSIALLIAIFLAAVAMVSPEQASQMYSDLKKNFAKSVLTCQTPWSCCNTPGSERPIDAEEYIRMKQEITDLQAKNINLTGKIKELKEDTAQLIGNVEAVKADNAALKAKIDDLSQRVKDLSDAENAIKEVVADLTTKIQAGADQDMIAQIRNLERLQAQTREELEGFIERLTSLEPGQKQTPTSGIFSYIDKDTYQALFIEKVEEALGRELTYAQIDEYLSSHLPPDLVKTIKDHPSLTKNYIRSLRRD
jgi:predicted  nucleic acid-binding Zn-ribbon protein